MFCKGCQGLIMKDIVFSKSFINLKLRNAVYVDKTKDIFYMLKQSDRIFLSRPRRFGKSLTLDTIGTLFEFGVDPYFKDTWIYSHWNEKTYTVIRLSMLDFPYSDFEEFSKSFCKWLSAQAQRCKVSLNPINESPAGYLQAFFNDFDLTHQLVILIDEYDYQLNHNLNDTDKYQQFLTCLRSVYGVLKDKPQIRFLGITGVTRLKNVSIFSVGSDIIDLTYKHVAATVTGYTRDEIAKYFKEYLDVIAQKLYKVDFNNCSPAEHQNFVNQLLDRMALEYDGYCFDEDYKQKVFSTWSVSSFLNENFFKEQISFGDYWFENGGVPSILANYLNTYRTDVAKYTQEELYAVTLNDFKNPTSLLTMSPTVLMCQTGYLTLRSVIKTGKDLLVGIPNNEISKALSALLYFTLTGKDAFISDENENVLTTGKVDEIKNFLNTVINSVPYDAFAVTDEASLRMLLLGFFKGAQLNVIAEKHNAKGRSDLEIDFSKRRLVIELKYAKSGSECEKALHEAIEQMKSRDYGNTLPLKEQIYKVALVFDGSADKRCFVKAAKV